MQVRLDDMMTPTGLRIHMLCVSMLSEATFVNDEENLQVSTQAANNVDSSGNLCLWYFCFVGVW